MRITLWFIVAAVVLPGSLAEAQHQSGRSRLDSTSLSRELAAVDGALLAAEIQMDTAAVARLLAPDFVWTSPEGVVWHRENRLGALLRGRRQPRSQQVLREELQSLSPDIALAVRRVRLISGEGATVRDRVVVMTRVYRRRAGTWEVAAQHASVLDSAAVAADSIARIRRP